MEHITNPENLSLCPKKVHYNYGKHEYSQVEVNEEGPHTPFSVCSKSSHGDANSEISIDTSILESEEVDFKQLRKKLEDLEYKVKYLENDNQRVSDDLKNERKKNAKLEKKLQFVRDNQEVFMRLKEAYINMKYNEAAGRKMTEIRERGVQTWEGILCGACLESEELRRQIDILMDRYKEMFVVSPGEMEHLLSTVKYLRDLIDRREKAWTLNMEKLQKLEEYVPVLEEENAKLRKSVGNEGNKNEVGQVKIENVNMEQEKKIEETQKISDYLARDLDKLKRLIVKYEKRIREIKQTTPGTFEHPLCEKEYRIVQQILLKHGTKTRLKYPHESARSPSPSEFSERSLFPRHRLSPRRHRGSARDGSCDRANSSDRSRTKQRANAIMMMDCLFD